MKNISVFIKGGTETLNFDKPIATYGSVIGAKEVTVFWNFKNITKAIDNGKFVIEKDPADTSSKDHEKTLGEGYWDFQQLKERLEVDKLKLSMNVHDNTCSITNETGSTVDLKKFGQLLGFPENYILQTGSTVSPKPVDVNHGLRWISVTCDLIDSSKNTGLEGEASTVLAFLPITPGTRLNSNCYVYERDAYAWRPGKNNVITQMTFKVESNLQEWMEIKVDVDILMNIALE